MSTPQGYNPLGESAPGLPRHDAPLPGHVPGQQFPPIGGGDAWAPTSGGGGSASTPNTGYSNAEPSAFGLWSGRIIMFCTIWITLPIQIGLYPIAGAVGLAGGAAANFVLTGSLMGPPSVLNWSYTACFAALLAAMRIETGLADRLPAYRTIRHVLRLALVAGGIYYLDVYQEMEPPRMAAIMALVFAVLAHFILRSKLLSGLWGGFQSMLWLRAN